ncbi:MAG TPA: hypothetical protein VGS58_09120 [Candidatus Sulfopaludibacter sp.]|nr:hypothetical protein [Candidatus Sulfopaludibacter sp.]
MPAFPWKRTAIALMLFGSAFGYVEAAVVAYLRLLHEPARQQFHPGRSSAELFPLLTIGQLRASGPDQQRVLAIELGREAATILMLAAVAFGVARSAGQWAAAFAIAFGTWDILFYVVLRLLLGWPASLFTWDVLFLIPVPWTAPVLAPVLVSAAMIGAGVWHLRREARGEPVAIGAAEWIGIHAGALVMVIAFAMDYGNILAGGMPQPFHWPVFAAGMAIGVGSYAAGAWRSGQAARNVGAAAHTVDAGGEAAGLS